MTLDENALEQALLAEPKNGEDWFDTVAGATGFTDEENRTLLRCAISAYLKALEGAGMVIEQGWQPIETAPKDGTRILVSDSQLVSVCRWVPEVSRVHYEEAGPGWFCDTLQRIRAPAKWQQSLRWRPLPAPPAMLSASEGE